MTQAHTNPRLTKPRRSRRCGAHAESLEGRLVLNAGDLDSSFGSGGSVRWSSPAAKGTTPSDVAQAVQVQADGKVLVAGGTGSPGSSDRFQVVRFNRDGSP